MTEMRKAADVVIVGGGVIGCSVARAAARAGLSVTLLEKGDPGREATWAAGGMLSPFGEAARPGPFLELGAVSLARYPDFVRGVEEASGSRVGYLECGKVELAFEKEGEAALRDQTEWLRGKSCPVRWLEPDELRDREPILSSRVRGALLLESEAQVDNRRLGPVLAEAARRAGARIHSDTRVRAVLRDRGRAGGVELVDGTRISAPRVVVAAGAWSGRLDGLPRSLPVRPVRGQMIALSPPDAGLSTVVDTSRAYLIPREGGPIVIGSTMEEAGFASETTAEAVAELLEAAMAAAPALSRSSVLETWSGLRPGTPDDLPIIGEDPDVPGLVYATGHFRNGILLAPVTVECVLPLLTGEDRPPVDLGPFRPDRFSGSGREAPGA